MKKKRITYGVSGMMEYQSIIRFGKNTLKVTFTGGSMNAIGVTPATYTTSSFLIQQAIENSNEFKRGRIRIVRTIELDEEIHIERPKPATAIAERRNPAPTPTAEAEKVPEHTEEAAGVTLIAGFKSPEDILFRDDFEIWKQRINVIQTVDSAPEGYEGPVGMVTKYIPGLNIRDLKNTAFITVGPPVMIKFTILEILKLNVPEENIWISHERKMCCGLGKCGHCKMDATYVCLDGPVFNYTVGKNLID